MQKKKKSNFRCAKLTQISLELYIAKAVNLWTYHITGELARHGRSPVHLNLLCKRKGKKSVDL